MTQFKVYASKDNEGQIIGATVVAYDGADRRIEKITVLDEQDVSALNRRLEEVNSTLSSRIKSVEDGKSDKGHNHDSSYYSKAYIDDLEDSIMESIAGIVSFDTVVVDVLPSTGVVGTFYFVPKDTGDELNNVYEEYVWVEGGSSFELVGSTEVSVDLSNYYTRSEVDALVEQSSTGNNQTYTVIPYGADLNDYKTSGLYVTEDFAVSGVYISGIENCPVGGNFLLEVYAFTDGEGNTGVQQILHSHKQIISHEQQTIIITTPTETYERVYTTDKWSGWYLNYNSHNFNPSEYYKKTETDTLLAGKANTSLASTSANGLMSSGDKSKLDGVATGANKTVVDSSMSSSSVNPVQNKIVYQELANKANTSHNHDDKYYTESEVDTKLNGKASSSHNHDSRYYTVSEMNNNLSGKSDISHTHTSIEQTFLPANADLNNYKTPGIYTDESRYDISSMKNVPLGWSFILEVKTTEGDLVLQTFTAIGSSSVRRLERIYHRSNGWSGWYEYTLTPLGGVNTIFYDPLTSNSGNWTIPAEVQSASSYSNDGWKINNNLNTQLKILLNNVIISSKNIEIEYIYMGMYAVNGLSMTIDITKNGNSTISVGYNPGSQQFQLYINNGSNQQNIPYSLQIGDKVTIVYDNSVLAVKVNDTAIGTYSEIIPDIMGSKVGTWVSRGNWFQIKDFTIKKITQ